MGRLIVHPALRFSRLRELTGLTAGNLATHLEALGRAGYVAQKDALLRPGPGKLVSLTAQGRTAFEAYLRDLEAHLRELQALKPSHEWAADLEELFGTGHFQRPPPPG